MNYIIIYLEIEHLLNFLTQEEKGDFLDLLICYGKTQKLPEIENKKLLNVFNFMKGRLDTQFEKAKIKAQTAKKNGANGGRPTKDKKPKANPIKPNKTQSVFSKPAVEEIRSYCLERKNNINAENFFDYYEARGWKLKTGIIKDWKACVRTWEKNNYNNNNYSQPPQTNSVSSSFDEKKKFYLENRNRIHPNLNEINDILNKIDNNQSKTQIIAYKAKTAFFVSNNANANLDLDEKLEKYFDLIVVLDYKTKEKYEL